MNIMNLVLNICRAKVYIDSTPKWKFITKYKQEKMLADYINNFRNLDIFTASEGMITFLLSIDRSLIIELMIISSDSLNMNINGYSFIYYPMANKFEVWNTDKAFTIYRNTRISRQINKIWEPLTYDIKEKYLKIILEVAESLNNERR